MGIFDALNTSVAGLEAQSFALQNISGNIANSSTVGYKGINTYFETLVANSSAGNQQVAGSVTAGSQQTITTPGTISSSTVATNMAINGDGFFSVQSPSGTTDGQPVFSGATDYTREGDFQVDNNGYLVNGSGYYLMGVPVDPKTGNPLGNVASVLQFNNSFMPAQATTTIQYAANLPSTPQTVASSTAASGSLLADGGLNTGDFGTNPLVSGTPPQPYGDATITGAAEGATITTGTALSGNGVGTIRGSAADNQTGSPVPISGATLLSGAPGTASLSAGFAAGDTITVGASTIQFYNSSTTPPTTPGSTPGTTYVDLATATVSNLLTDIDQISTTGTPSAVSGGKITLNDDAGNVTVTSSNTAAFAALGLGATGSISTTAGTVTGTVADNQNTTPVPVTSATLLSGAAGTYSVSHAFQSGEDLVVNGQTISFYDSTGSTGPTSPGGAANTTYLDLATASVGDLLQDIDSISGTTNPSTISGTGVITLNDNKGSLSISSTDAGALNALGFGNTGSASSATNAITTNFAAGDTITVDGKTISFYDSNNPGGTGPTSAGSATGTTYVDLATATIGDLLKDIDSITGSANSSTMSSTGAITLHTGTDQDLALTSSNISALGALGFSQNTSMARTGGGQVGAGVVVGSDVTAFDNESISGGAVTAYTASGTPVNVELRWVKTDSSALGSPHQDTWNLFYQADPNATGSDPTDPAWVNVGTNFTFNSSGDLTSPTGADITIPGVTIGGQSLGDLTLNVGSSGLTQFATTSGAVTINSLNQDGYAAGQLNSIAINNSGLVVGTFSNGQNIDLAEVPLVHFNGTNFLQALSGNAYAATTESGAAIAGASGTIDGSSLEGSNTDIADEFTKLIVTQQAYSANTKVITTANDMVQDLLNVLR